ncbi:MAG: arsenate reductase ArsC [bacterium]
MKRILFVCVENSCRSQMAEAFARMEGKEGVDIYSAGSNPSGVVNPKAIESMKEVAYDLSRHGSKSLSEIPDVEYDVVVTMGCGDKCPFVRAKRREDWKIPDPKELSPEGFREIREKIRMEVTRLLKELSL